MGKNNLQALRSEYRNTGRSTLEALIFLPLPHPNLAIHSDGA